MSIVVKRVGAVLFCAVICFVVCLGVYWNNQRAEVTQVSQSGLNNVFHSHVTILKVQVVDSDGLMKWIILPFRQHMWFVTYKHPQAHSPSMATVIKDKGNWFFQMPPRLG